MAEASPVPRRSNLTGRVNVMAFDAETAGRIHEWLAMDRDARPFVQNAFPALADDEREFLLTGVTPKEWGEAFGGSEE